MGYLTQNSEISNKLSLVPLAPLAPLAAFSRSATTTVVALQALLSPTKSKSLETAYVCLFVRKFVRGVQLAMFTLYLPSSALMSTSTLAEFSLNHD